MGIIIIISLYANIFMLFSLVSLKDCNQMQLFWLRQKKEAGRLLMKMTMNVLSKAEGLWM